MSRPLSLASAAAFVTALVATTPLAAAAQDVVTVTLTVGGRTYNATGAGQCRSEPVASIYGVRAALWAALARLVVVIVAPSSAYPLAIRWLP